MNAPMPVQTEVCPVCRTGHAAPLCNRLTLSNGRIVVAVLENVAPPVPVRKYDWRAYEQDQEEAGIYGWGQTREDALSDLLIELESRL